ncbi:hypothetical protein GCM10027043_38170 [Ferruginibacter profundus]
MHLKKQNIFFCVSKISALLLIIPLFFIQGFFNYDNVLDCGYTKLTTSKEVNQHAVKFNNNKPNNKQTSIRLNKRFQPESAPHIEIVYFEVPGYFFVTNSFSAYADPFLALPHLCRGILRGPPAVA